MQFMMITDNHSIGNHPYNFQLHHGFAHPLSGTTTETLLPVMYEATTNLDFFKADSGLTYSLPISRKRSRDTYPFFNAPNMNQNLIQSTSTFLGQDISTQIQHQHLEIDRFLAFHVIIISLISSITFLLIFIQSNLRYCLLK